MCCACCLVVSCLVLCCAVLCCACWECCACGTCVHARPTAGVLAAAAAACAITQSPSSSSSTDDDNDFYSPQPRFLFRLACESRSSESERIGSLSTGPLTTLCTSLGTDPLSQGTIEPCASRHITSARGRHDEIGPAKSRPAQQQRPISQPSSTHSTSGAHLGNAITSQSPPSVQSRHRAILQQSLRAVRYFVLPLPLPLLLLRAIMALIGVEHSAPTATSLITAC